MPSQGFLQRVFCFTSRCVFSEGRPSCSFLSDDTIAYFAKIWPYFVASDGSEQHKTHLIIPLQSDA